MMSQATEHKDTEPRGATRRVVSNGHGPAPYRARLESIGSCVPEQTVTARQVVEGCVKKPQVDLEVATGIKQKRVSAPHQDSYTLALHAAQDCLAHSSHKPEDLEMLVFCGITRYDGGINTMRFAPSISTRLKLALGARNAMVVDLSNACAGMMSGLYVVDDFIKRGAVKVAMVVSGEYISHLASNAQRHVDNGHHLEAASLTLGDAGAAFIAEQTTQPGAGLLGTVFNTFSEHVDLCTGTPCADAPGGEMFTRSKEIHEAGIMNTPDVVGRLLAKVGLKMGDVDHVIIHQTSVKAIQKCNQLVSAVLGPQPKTDWIVNVDTHGNSASTTHFVALRRFLGEGRFKKGARIMLVTQASGLVVGATVFTMDQLGDRYGNTH